MRTNKRLLVCEVVGARHSGDTNLAFDLIGVTSDKARVAPHFFDHIYIAVMGKEIAFAVIGAYRGE